MGSHAKLVSLLLRRSNFSHNQFKHLKNCRFCSSSTSSSSTVKDSKVNDDKGEAKEYFDIVIAGGGLVGTSMALALGTSKRLANLKILLLESSKKLTINEFTKEKNPNFSNRVVALSPSSKKFLEKINVWPGVWRYKEATCLQVWDALSDASINFQNPNFSSPVSYIVENIVLSNAISDKLEEVSNVTVGYGSKLISCNLPNPTSKNTNEQVTLKINDGNTLETKLLIGADGFNSLVRNTMKSPYLNFNYDRTAIVATLKLLEPTDNNIAWQRFVPTGGPIALLPLSNEFSSLVWSTTPEKAKELLNLSDLDFVDAVNSSFWKEYPKTNLVQKSCDFLSTLKLGGKGPKIFPPSVSSVLEKSRASFPLGFGHSTFYVSRRTALIGDAAHRVHPLAGQGLNLGFGDVETLQKVIEDAVGLGGDIGDLLYLKEYETKRQRHNVAIQSGIDFLHRLYNIDISPVVALRTIGLSLVNSSNIIKKWIISQAAA